MALPRRLSSPRGHQGGPRGHWGWPEGTSGWPAPPARPVGLTSWPLPHWVWQPPDTGVSGGGGGVGDSPTIAVSPNMGNHGYPPLKKPILTGAPPGEPINPPFPRGSWGVVSPPPPQAVLAFPPVFPNVPALIRSRSCFCATFSGPAVANLRSNVRAAGSFLLPALAPAPPPPFPVPPPRHHRAPRARGRPGTPDLF